jgi:predicted transposase YbfD/YdcC
VFASTKAAALEALSAWPGLRTVLAVETIRSVNGTDKVESEIRYFLSSGADDPATLGAAIRMHWSIENALHWVLDVTSVRTTALCVIAGPRAISHSCVRSRSTLLAVTDQPRPACAPSGKRPPGTTTICSNS